MKYDFTIKYSIEAPYWNDQNEDITKKEVIVNNTTTEYCGLSLENLHRVLRDELDYPNNKLTTVDVRSQFSDAAHPVTNEDILNKIANYYNMRLDLFNKINEELNKPFDEEEKVITFSIPSDACGFTTMTDDAEYKLTKYLDCFVKIVIKK